MSSSEDAPAAWTDDAALPPEVLLEDLPPHVGPYDTLGVAGRGNMGTVYVGRDPSTERTVAIKLCTLGDDRGAAAGATRLVQKLFVNEARVAALLDHPNILRVLDAAEHQGHPYIVMEYVDARLTLNECTSPNSLLPVRQVVEIVYQCAKALDYAHRRGVVHRDIKPGNIMLTRDGAVKICDFGIATYALTETTEVMGMLGTPRYMSPEQASEEEVGHETDIYSLGVVLYELLTGRPMFVAKSLPKLIDKIRNEPPPSPRRQRPELPDSLCRVVLRSIEKNPARRYPMGCDMAADLAGAFGDLAA